MAGDAMGECGGHEGGQGRRRLMEGLGGGIKGLESIDSAGDGLQSWVRQCLQHFSHRTGPEERMELLLLQQRRAFSLWKNKDKSGSA